MKSEFVLILVAAWCACARCADNSTDYENNAAVNTFREYIRINTSHPASGDDVNYDEAVAFWQTQATSLGLNATVLELYSGKPIVVITWPGSNTSLPSIMLNSHMDVVAADETTWTYPPFNATLDSNGIIYGRGTQDMKSVGIQYLEAIRNLMADNVTLTRTVHMTMVPDEEIGGTYGMKLFAKSDEFAAMNVGFAMDEGIAWPNASYIVFYADKTIWQIQVTCTGPGGHASTMPTDTAAAKFYKIIAQFLDYRETQQALIAAGYAIGNVTSINLTGVSGGTANNIIPSSLTATFDMRLAVGTNMTEFNATVASWIANGSDDGTCTHSYILYEDVSPSTLLDEDNVYWVGFLEAAAEMSEPCPEPTKCPPPKPQSHSGRKPPSHSGPKPPSHSGPKPPSHLCEPRTAQPKCITGGMDSIITMISPGTTDERFVRVQGVSAIGFSPMPFTYPLLHSVNEYLGASTFLNGIDIYYNLLLKIANA